MDRGLWLRLTALCGTLDIFYAAVVSVVRDSTVGDMLRGVAAGPFGDAAKGWDLGGAAVGLLTHYSIMAVMVAAGLWLVTRPALSGIAAWKTGTLFGVLSYAVMYGLVLKLRFGMPFPNPDPVKVGLGLFPHIFLVGIPIALAAQGRLFRR